MANMSPNKNPMPVQDPQIRAKNFKEVAGEGVFFSLNKNKYFVGRKSKETKATIVEVFENDEKIGIIHLTDQIKETSRHAISALSKMNIQSVLLSGDNTETVTIWSYPFPP